MVKPAQGDDRIYVIYSARGEMAKVFHRLTSVKEPGADPNEMDPFVTHQDIAKALSLGKYPSYERVESAMRAGGVSFDIVSEGPVKEPYQTYVGRLGGNGTFVHGGQPR